MLANPDGVANNGGGELRPAAKGSGRSSCGRFLVKLSCSVCAGQLARHCRNEDCDWWTCPTRECDAETYDVHRGLLRHADGVVEHL